MTYIPPMAPPPKHILTAPWGSDTRRAEDRARAKENLERRARRVSWRALQELERRVDSPERAAEIETTELVQIAKLGGGLSKDHTVTVSGDMQRPLVIGLAPLPALPEPDPTLTAHAPEPELTDRYGRLKPLRLTLPTATGDAAS